MLSIRFKQNYLLTAVRTEQTDDGLTVIKDQHHVKKGEIYAADQVNLSGNTLTIFWGENIIKGVSSSLDKDLCEVISPEIISQKKAVNDGQKRPGCGTCGGRGHK